METDSYDRRPGSGRPRCNHGTIDIYNYIIVSVLRDRHITSVEIKNNLQQIGVKVSDDCTIRRRLVEKNLQYRRPVLVPALKYRHREARLNFAMRHQRNIHDWSRVLFTDECRFYLIVRAPDRRERVYCRPGELFAPCAMKKKENFNDGSIMVWAGISTDPHTDLF